MASKIIRRKDRAEGGITDAERAAMAEHTKTWIANAMRTDRADPQEVREAIVGLYAAAGLPEPRVVLVPSPRIMAFAGGFASAIWWLRENQAPDSNAATSGTTRSATLSATYSATRSATDAATRSATDAATRSATRSATYSATDAATRSATDAATRSATYSATDAATNEGALFFQIARDILGPQYATFGLACAKRWYGPYQGGNMWSPWDCYLTAARDILGLELPEHKKYAAWERAAKCGGFRWMHEKFCIVSDFPERLCVDAQNRPHSSDGPSHRWRDGWELYYWHGVRVTQQIVMEPQTLTIEQVRAEENAEVRRVMIERMGHERYLRECGATLAHEDRYGKLWRAPRPDDTDIVMVEVINSTPEPDGSRNRYMLRVPPTTQTAHEGVAWTFGKTVAEYAPRVET